MAKFKQDKNIFISYLYDIWTLFDIIQIEDNDSVRRTSINAKQIVKEKRSRCVCIRWSW